MKIDLTNKRILITGASRGIGKAIAELSGKSGATIAVHYNSSKEQAENVSSIAGNGSFAIQADLTRPEEVKQMFNSAVERLGGLDVLINNAGVAILTDPQSDRWDSDWEKTMAVNLKAPTDLSRMALKVFEKQKSGRIINVVSRASHRGDTKEYMAYAASKAGLHAFSKSIARAYGKDNIACFSIAPGFVKTDMAQDFIDKYGEDYVVNDLSLANLTEPADVAPLAVLLASGLADHSTGATFDVNAGSYIR